MFTATFSKAFEDGGNRGKIILVGDPQAIFQNEVVMKTIRR